jgi:hypothetical protein
MSIKKNNTNGKANGTADYTVSIKDEKGIWKFIDMDKLPKTEADWKIFFEKKKAKIKESKEFLKCEFTHEEIHAKGQQLARINAELSAIESEAKAVASNFKAMKDGKVSEIEVLANHINTGFEHKHVPCLVIYNSPNATMKQVVRKDTGEIIRTESMTADELQLELEFEKN